MRARFTQRVPPFALDGQANASPEPGLIVTTGPEPFGFLRTVFTELRLGSEPRKF